jgi:hypothetical protein
VTYIPRFTPYLQSVENGVDGEVDTDLHSYTTPSEPFDEAMTMGRAHGASKYQETPVNDLGSGSTLGTVHLQDKYKKMK